MRWIYSNTFRYIELLIFIFWIFIVFRSKFRVPTVAWPSEMSSANRAVELIICFPSLCHTIRIKKSSTVRILFSKMGILCGNCYNCCPFLSTKGQYIGDHNSCPQILKSLYISLIATIQNETKEVKKVVIFIQVLEISKLWTWIVLTFRDLFTWLLIELLVLS